MNGLTKGFQLMVDFFSLKHKIVVTDGNEEARADFDAVEDQWNMELTATTSLAAALKKGKFNEQALLLALATGKDPFKGSRQMLQDLKAKWA